jgi:hypothetical protein
MQYAIAAGREEAAADFISPHLMAHSEMCEEGLFQHITDAQREI